MSVAVLALAVRYLLVMLFFPFSALDKILNFRGAVGQASEIVASPGAGDAADPGRRRRRDLACRSPS